MSYSPNAIFFIVYIDSTIQANYANFGYIPYGHSIVIYILLLIAILNYIINNYRLGDFIMIKTIN